MKAEIEKVRKTYRKFKKVKKVKKVKPPDSPDLSPAGLGGDWTGAIWISGRRRPEIPVGPFLKHSLPE